MAEDWGGCQATSRWQVGWGYCRRHTFYVGFVMRRLLLVLGVLSGVLLMPVLASASTNWSAAVALSEAGQSAYVPLVAMSADGTTQTITWYRYDGADLRVQATTSADSGQTWSDVETLSEVGQGAWYPEMAMSADGTTQTITWRRYDGANWRVQTTNGDF